MSIWALKEVFVYSAYNPTSCPMLTEIQELSLADFLANAEAIEHLLDNSATDTN